MSIDNTGNEQTRVVNTSIEIDNSTNITPFTSLSLVQRADFHHSFELRVPLEVVEGRNHHLLNQSANYIGKPIKISVETRANGTQLNVFNGVITAISLSRHSGNASDLLITGFSPTVLMDDGPHTASFTQKSLSQIFNTVCNPYPSNLLKKKCSPNPDTQIPFIVQYNESNFQFLSRLADTHGQWLYYNGKELVMGRLDQTNEVEVTFGHDLASFELGLRVAPVKFDAVGYDYVNNQIHHAKSKGIQVSGLDSNGDKAMRGSESLYGNEQVIFESELITNQSELNDLAKYRKSSIAGEMVICTGTSDNPKIRIGTKLTIKGRQGTSNNTDSYGSYTVISVTHYIDGLGMYQCRFQAIPSSITIPPNNRNIKDPICEVQPAKVTDNNDSDGMGRLKVQFQWMPDGESTPWIRFVTPHGGNGRGFQFLPEKDDEVLVSFENNNPSRPFVMGSLYHGKANHSDRHNSDNHAKVIRTVSGNEINFHDEGGKESIHILNKDGKNEIKLSMENSGSILVHSKGDISIKAEGNMDFEAKKTTFQLDSLKIETKQDMELTVGSDFKRTVTGDEKASMGGKLEITAGGDTTQTYGGKYTLLIGSSKTVTIGSSLSETIASGYTLTIGANASVTAGANYTLLAPMVMIN